MLLGINAHVQNDMPFVLASLGLRTPSGAVPQGRPRRDEPGAEPRLRARRSRRSRSATTTGSRSTNSRPDAARRSWRARDGAGLARGGVAERRAARSTPAATRSAERIALQIQANAAAWARAHGRRPRSPADRAQRDAYCRCAAPPIASAIAGIDSRADGGGRRRPQSAGDRRRRDDDRHVHRRRVGLVRGRQGADDARRRVGRLHGVGARRAEAVGLARRRKRSARSPPASTAAPRCSTACSPARACEIGAIVTAGQEDYLKIERGIQTYLGYSVLRPPPPRDPLPQPAAGARASG